MLIFILVIFVFSVLILVHEAGHLLVAKRVGVKVETFSLGYGKRLFGVVRGGTDYRVSLVPFGGYVKMAGEDPHEATGSAGEVNTMPVGYRFWIITAGSITNYVFAFLLFVVIFMAGVPTLTTEVGEVLKGYPAEKAGLTTGDRIVSVGEKGVKYWEDILKAINSESRASGRLKISFVRGDKAMEVEVAPEVTSGTNIFGETISRPMIGIAPQSKIISVAYNPVQAVYLGGKKLLELTGVTYQAIWLLLTGGMSLKASISGPIGIAHMMGQSAQMGVMPLLITTAHVSLALAVFNLLPFPVLDGGHVVFLIIEKIRRKPVSVKVQEVLTQAALVLLIAFAVFVSWQDLIRFTPLGAGRSVAEGKK